MKWLIEAMGFGKAAANAEIQKQKAKRDSEAVTAAQNEAAQRLTKEQILQNHEHWFVELEAVWNEMREAGFSVVGPIEAERLHGVQSAHQMIGTTIDGYVSSYYETAGDESGFGESFPNFMAYRWDLDGLGTVRLIPNKRNALMLEVANASYRRDYGKIGPKTRQIAVGLTHYYRKLQEESTAQRRRIKDLFADAYDGSHVFACTSIEELKTRLSSLVRRYAAAVTYIEEQKKQN
jgi:hypothetical protein